MRIVYIIRKGLQTYPPCLMNILILKDLNIDVFVIHGKNTKYINDILNQRKIQHIELKSDKGLSKNKIQSIYRYIYYIYEINKIIAKYCNEVIWFGNETSLCGVSLKKLKKLTFVSSVLELNDKNILIDSWLKKYLPLANIVCCPEKHRAQIIKSRYNLIRTPYIIPNKPYENKIQDEESAIEVNKKEISLLYQGVLDKDRPIFDFARALKVINDKRIVFYIMGNSDASYKKKIKSIYERTVFINYVPAPLHLSITKQCKIGVLLYDDSCLNNIFCAPNKVYEYSRFGLPMISSDNIALLETIGTGQAAECINYRDISSVRCAIQKIINNYKYYSKKSFEFYKKQDNYEIIKEIINLLENASI